MRHLLATRAVLAAHSRTPDVEAVAARLGFRAADIEMHLRLAGRRANPGHQFHVLRALCIVTKNDVHVEHLQPLDEEIPW